MDESDHTICLRELSRLLNLWQEHGFAPAHPDALVSWAQESASRSRLAPRPDIGLLLLDQLALAMPQSDGSLCPAAEVTSGWSEDDHRLDELPSSVSFIVLERLLADEEFRITLDRVFGCVPFTSTDLQFKWDLTPQEMRREVGWILLQQLGLCLNDGENVELSVALAPYIVQTPPANRPMSQRELDERLIAQREMALLAEQHIVRIEQERLRTAGNDDLASGVYRISEEDVEAGFDVLSFEFDGRSRRIEVKASAGPRERFFISRNELSKASEYGETYWIAWLSFSERLPDGQVEVNWFRNPTRILELEAGPWQLVPDHFMVLRVGDDSQYISQHAE